jgi:steroid 5-alpha reductase family enzyme
VTLGCFGLALATVAALMAAAMTTAWLVERRTGNSGWIDAIWTFGLGTTGIAGALLPFGEGPPSRRLLVAALAAAWALRLGLHVAARTRGISDDPRYAKLKRDWGADKDRQMFRFMMMQALASTPLAMGIVLAAHNPALALGLQDLLGVLVFALGVGGGAVADRQLRAFAQEPANKGKVCDTGLWAWSRHPNYFFECVLWCAYPVIAIAAMGYPFGFAALLAPLCITVLLVKISGIPPLEEHMVAKHGDAYRAYQRRTSALLPWPPAAGRA